MGRLPLYRPEQLFTGSVLSQQGQRFFMDLQLLLGNIGGIDWGSISKAGASLEDIDPTTTLDVITHLVDGTIHHTLEAIQDDIASLLTQGNAITLAYDDTANTLTVSVTQVAAAADTAITVAGSAGAAYTAAEQGMIDALAADVTTLNDAMNTLKANMRTAGILEP
jgi:ABC-type amino acid transport substrate-binding protein